MATKGSVGVWANSRLGRLMSSFVPSQTVTVTDETLLSVRWRAHTHTHMHARACVCVCVRVHALLGVTTSAVFHGSTDKTLQSAEWLVVLMCNWSDLRAVLLWQDMNYLIKLKVSKSSHFNAVKSAV